MTKMIRNCDFLTNKIQCRKCGSEAIIVPGKYYWCPKCGWQPYIKSNGNHTVF